MQCLPIWENTKRKNEKLRGRNFGGRKKHDEAWMASYNDFAIKLENGMRIAEIAKLIAEIDLAGAAERRNQRPYTSLRRIDLYE